MNQTWKGSGAEMKTDVTMALLAEALSADGREPRFERIERALADAIADGRLSPGAILPTEPDLAAGLGVSRQTIGRALSQLAKRGLLTRRRGIGTFVANQPFEHRLDRLYSFVQTLSRDGAPPATRLLGARLTVDADASPLLTGTDDGLVMEIGRLFMVDDAPVVVEYAFLSPECGQSIPAASFGLGVIDDLMRAHCGLSVDRGDEMLSLTKLNRTNAALLDARLGEPAFLVTRVAHANDRVVQFRRSVIRADRARFHVRLAGAALEGSGELAPRLDPIFEKNPSNGVKT